jgi:hypothetical protein
MAFVEHFPCLTHFEKLFDKSLTKRLTFAKKCDIMIKNK